MKINQLAIPAAYHTRALMKTNDRAAKHGLVLSEADAAQIIASADETLRSLGRIELSNTLIPKLITAFVDSPYIIQDEYTETICQLLECFYYLKNECQDEVSDDELIEIMRNVFDYEGGGAVELLPEKLKHRLLKDD
jgi:hypothetical protein